MRLACGSNRRPDDHVLKMRSDRKHVRPRTLRRDAAFREYDDDQDFRWAWAAYRLGAFADHFAAGIEQEEFRMFLAQFRERGLWFTLLARVKWQGVDRGIAPVGLIACDVPERKGRPELQPHVLWYPWASPRNKLEAGLKFFNDLRKTTTVLIFAKATDECDRYFGTLKKYQVLRRVGTAYDHFDAGEPSHVWQVK